MLSGDCNVCINGKMPTYSETCVECGLSRKNYKPMTNADRIRQRSDEELAAWLEGLVQIVAESGGDAFDQSWIEWLKEEAKEHPIITNADKFEEVFGHKPNGKYVCPVPMLDRSCAGVSCKTCINWWNEPYKEPEGVD